MSEFDAYRDAYRHVRLQRDDGILTVTLHSEGDSLRWGPGPFSELPDLFRQIGSDRENQVVILTGTGQEFCGPRASPSTRFYHHEPSAEDWEDGVRGDYHLIWNHLNIEVPVICAVNGPAYRRSELALLADIIIASPSASFEDSHFRGSQLVPGDGLGQLFMTLLGLNRARYMLLTGTSISAEAALAAGLIGEVVEADRLLDRAHELAHELLQQPPLLRRSTRRFLTHPLKRMMAELLTVGQSIESFSGSHTTRGEGEDG